MIKKNKTKAAWIVTAIVVTLAIVVLMIDLFAFPLEYLSVKIKPTKVVRAEEGDFSLYYPDVDGHAVVVQFPNGEFGLIGTGKKESYQKVLRLLEGLKVKRLAFVALTSAADGEIGGAQRVLDYVKTERLFLVPDVKTRPSYPSLESLAKKKKTEIAELAFGTSLGDFGVSVRALGACTYLQSGFYYEYAPIWIDAGGGVLIGGYADWDKVWTATQVLAPEMNFVGLHFLETLKEDQADWVFDMSPMEVVVQASEKEKIEAVLPDGKVVVWQGAYQFTIKQEDLEILP